MESTSLLEEFGNPLQRVERAIEALKHGNGILLMVMRTAKMKVT